MGSNWYYKLIWSRSFHAILCGCNRRCLQDIFKRFQNSETTSRASGGAIGASRLNFQLASSFTSGTACFIFTIERTLRGRSMNSKSAGYPRFRLFTPNPPVFFRGIRWQKKNSRSACIDASRLIFHSAVSFQIRLVAKKQALVFLHLSGKTQRIHRTDPKKKQAERGSTSGTGGNQRFLNSSNAPLYHTSTYILT